MNIVIIVVIWFSFNAYFTGCLKALHQEIFNLRCIYLFGIFQNNDVFQAILIEMKLKRILNFWNQEWTWIIQVESFSFTLPVTKRFPLESTLPISPIKNWIIWVLRLEQNWLNSEKFQKFSFSSLNSHFWEKSTKMISRMSS